jgi:CRISPR system Cascade subunit CasD
LAALAEAMRTPGFVTYLGRKSCPLGLPLAPAVGEAENAVAALLARHDSGPEARWRQNFVGHLDADVTIVLDTPDVDSKPGDPGHIAADDERRLRIEVRRDQLRSRRRWQFDLRHELVLGVPRP